MTPTRSDLTRTDILETLETAAAALLASCDADPKRAAHVIQANVVKGLGLAAECLTGKEPEPRVLLDTVDWTVVRINILSACGHLNQTLAGVRQREGQRSEAEEALFALEVALGGLVEEKAVVAPKKNVAPTVPPRRKAPLRIAMLAVSDIDDLA